MKETKILCPGVSGLAYAGGVLMKSDGKLAVAMRAADGTLVADTASGCGGAAGVYRQSKLVAETADAAGCRMQVLTADVLMFLAQCAALFTPLPDIPLWLFPAEAAFRVGLTLLCCWAVTRTKWGRRLCMYHGAEHKAINCCRKGLPLTLANAKTQSRRSTSCGSNSTVVQLVLMALFASLVPWFPLRLPALPLSAAASKCIWRYAQRHSFALARRIAAGGMALQRITTAEPEDGMLEAAVKALKLVTPKPPAVQRQRVRKRRAG